MISLPLFIAYLDWRTFMNTRVFKDISKVQHRAWLGF
ncbi:PrgI family protein, partial [Streptococcus suis]|nr:PrgI family protein [Streptococcus suis]MCP8327932.1 PrgI family protein [Streptococcus suis]MCP8638635.1 PrgI family protein [Streptococcus suis]MCP8639270.1 PrgI family protein [Streptococcus suis]MCP8640333.1 PrgI family protein [Streptococcus suis]